MNINEFPIEIRSAQEYEVDFLEKEFSPGDKSRYHVQRFQKQKEGKGLYLIAWHNTIPVGHFLLEWEGPQDMNVRKFVDITQRAYLLAGGTRSEYRKKGVATRLIQEAERLAKEHGCIAIGLTVGESDNPTARRLYEKLGYTDWGHGPFTISWNYVGADGTTGTESELVVYMEKPL